MQTIAARSHERAAIVLFTYRKGTTPMIINIDIDTSQPLSDVEKAALRLLIGCDPVAEAAPAYCAHQPELLEGTPAEVFGTAAPAPTPAVEEATMEEAIQVATKMVAEGKATQVKTALSSLGVKRVSDLKGEDIASFINSLS